jgi:hypothetical protein
MDLLQLVQNVIVNEPDHQLLAGRCVHEGSSYTIYPDSSDEGFAMVVESSDVVGPLIHVMSHLAPPVSGAMQALRIRKGARLLIRHHGVERHCDLTPEKGREVTLALRDPPEHGTCGRLLAEFECDTGRYLGWCFGWWNCLFPDPKC